MNGYDDYDVDDDLPRNIPDKPQERASNNVRINNKNMKQLKEKESAQDSAKLARKPRPKLDFNRLLRGSRGLGYLAVTAKNNLKLSGRPGAEAQDLSQICIYLQEWSKLVFPKMNVVDFLMKSEEICQSRIMKECVPQLLSKLKEIGEDANLGDLATVESEILTRMATEEAEKALESINSGLSQPMSAQKANGSNESDDFDLQTLLSAHKSSKGRAERSEIIRDTDEMDSEEEDDEEYSKEMAGFINDSENDSEDEASSSNDNENMTSRTRGISLSFESSESEESETENVLEGQDDDAPQKKRSARVIMSDEE